MQNYNIKEDYFGKIIIKETKNTIYLYIIVGYDMLKKQYLVIDIIDYNLNYHTISQVDECYDYNTIINYMNDYINHYQKLKNIILEKEIPCIH